MKEKSSKKESNKEEIGREISDVSLVLSKKSLSNFKFVISSLSALK